MNIKCQILTIVMGCLFTGCQTVNNNSTSATSKNGQVKIMRSAAEAIAGKTLSDDELKKLSDQVQNDPEAQSAVQSITQSMSGNLVKPKYCPVDGRRYAPNLTKCSEHNVELKTVGE